MPLSIIYGQELYQFRGRVMDTDSIEIHRATVSIKPLNKLKVTNRNGQFYFSGLSDSDFEVQISFLGYDTLNTNVSLGNNNDYRFYLNRSLIGLSEAVIKDDYINKQKEITPLSIEIVDAQFLKQNMNGSLMKSLENLPGVSTIDIGSGQSKPVIRGLGFNRVVVVENGIKHEAQQWGADHGLEIDQYAVENVQVIKGPSSLMYGSDAIGGVIKLKSHEVPAKNSFDGSVDLSGKTNNDFLGTSISLFTRKNDLFFTARATLVSFGDFSVPTDSVDIYNYRVPLYQNQIRNSAGEERNLHTSFGILKDQFQSKFFISNVTGRGGFFANAHGLEPRNVDHSFHDASSRDIQYPRQEFSHFKAINKSTYSLNKARFDVVLGYQKSFRQEWSQYVQHGFMPAVFSESLDFDPSIERQFDKQIFSGNASIQYDISVKTELTSGLSSEYQINDIGGRGFIIPAFKQFTAGVFSVAKHKISDKQIFQAGVRYDYGNVQTENHFDWFESPVEGSEDFINLQRAEGLSRDFSNLSWSLGYNHNTDKWSYRINVGKSFRMPIPKELAANGINYHRFSFEVGDADLSPEIAYQVDAGLDYSSRKIEIGLSPFFNYFTNYIFLNPTSEFDRQYGFGNQIFEYTESEVARYGGELNLEYNLHKKIKLGAVGEYVYAQQLSGDKKGFTLPFAPPASGILSLTYETDQFGAISNPYMSLNYRITGPQNNIVPPEEMTDGFQMFSLNFGGEYKVKEQYLSVSVQVQNLLNTKYFNHASYYRLINVPEPSRNIVINISVPFSGKKEKTI